MKSIYKKLSVVLLFLLSVIMAVCAGIYIPSRASADENPAPVEEQLTEEWFEVTVDSQSLSVMFDAASVMNGAFNKGDLSKFRSELAEAVKTLLIDNIFPDQQQEQGPQAVSSIVPLAGDPNPQEGLPDIDLSNKDLLKRYEDYIRERLQEPGELDKYLNGEYDVLIKYAVDQYLQEHEEITDEHVQKLTEQVTGVVDEVIEKVYKDDPVKQQEAKDLNKQNVTDIVTEVKEQGSANITMADLLNMLQGLDFGDAAIYRNGKFSAEGLKALLRTLPTPNELANGSGPIILTYNVTMQTTMGEVDFLLTVGLKGECATVRRAAKFIADHVDVVKDGNTYKVNLKVPEAASKVLAKALNSNSVPEDVKRAFFSLADKTADQLVEDTDAYSFERLTEFVKGVDFKTIFTNLLNADYLNNYFSQFGDFGKFTDEKIDNILDKICKMGARLSELDVKEVENFLQGLGLPGIPARLESAANEFLALLGKLDFENYNAARIREYIKDGDKLDGLVDRFTNSPKVEKLYNRFIDAAQRLFEVLPQRLQNGKVINTYDGAGDFSWQGNTSFTIQGILNKLANNLPESFDTYLDVIPTYFSEEALAHRYSFDVDLNVSFPGIYKVAYDFGDEVKQGLLPVNADAAFFANATSVNGKDILFWVNKDNPEEIFDMREEGATLPMPSKDITLVPVTGFDTEIQISDGGVVRPGSVYGRKYSGNAVSLTANVSGGTGYVQSDLTYAWYKVDGTDRQLLPETSAVLNLTDVADSGTYICVATNELSNEFSIDSEALQAAEITITPAEVSFAAADWDYDIPIIYDGNSHRVSLVGAPAGYEFEYKGVREAILVGDYEVWVELTDKNYVITDLAQGTEANPLKWSIVDKTPVTPDEHDYTFKLGDTTFRVRDLNGVLPAGSQLEVTMGTQRSNDEFKSYMPEGKVPSLMYVYDIHFTGFSGTGAFAVELENNAFSGKQIVLVHFHGSSQEQLQISASGNKITFNTNGFSDFAVVEVQPEPVTPPPTTPTDEEKDGGIPWWVWLLVAIIILLLIIIIIIIIIVVKRRGEEDDVPPVIIINEEEEVPVEEHIVEEEVTEPEPEPAPEPEPEPETKEESAPIVILPVEEEAVAIDDDLYSVYDKSFMARLSQADDVVKGYYSELKNDILAYKGVKSRVSWHYDAFNKGRNKLLRLQIRGKSLYMYIALNPTELDEKYHVKDVSDISRYEEVPTALKIKSNRGLKYAKALVAMLMDRLDVERGELPNEDYKPAYETTESLLNSGRIKIKLTKNNFAALRKEEKDDKDEEE